MFSFEPSCWSEHGQLEAVLLCQPSMLSVPDLQTAEDVKWSAPVNQQKAQEQFHTLRQTLENTGADVIDYAAYLSAEDRALSDQLINRFYVRDLACVFGTTILPSQPMISMRKPEYVQAHLLFEQWFPEAFSIDDNDDFRALEYGDVLVLNKDAVFINVGMRTSKESVARIKEKIFQAGFSEIGIIDLPRRSDTFHLDMNCNVAGEGVVVAKSYLRYFPVEIITESSMRYDMTADFLDRHGFEIYWLEKYDTNPDINFFNIDPETLLISKQTHKQMLKKHPKLAKKNFIEIEVSELEKGGGGIRCMTLPLRRKS